MKKFSSARRLAVFGAIAAGALALSACSGGSGSSTEPTDSAAVAAAVDKAQEGAEASLAVGVQENEWTGPDTSPVPKTGLKLTIISQMNATGAARPAHAIEEAAKLLGWIPTIVDNQGKPDLKLAAVNAAVDDKADAIALVFTDPSIVASGIQRAQDAGIALISFGVPKDTGFGIPDVHPDYQKQGESLAQYMVWKGGADVHLLLEEASDEYAITDGHDPAARDYIENPENCPGCTVQTKQYVLSNFLDPTSGPAAQGSAALQADPSLNWVTCFDACLFQVISSIDRAGLSDRVQAAGWGCNPENLGFILDDHVEKACMADAYEWQGWATVDNLNRLTNEEEPFDYTSAIPTALFDKESLESLPADQVQEIVDAGWNGNYDFRAKFAELWGK